MECAIVLICCCFLLLILLLLLIKEPNTYFHPLMTSARHTYIRHLQARMYPPNTILFFLLTRTRDTRTSHFTFQDISSNIVRCSDPSNAGLSRRCFQLLLHSTLMTVCSYICGTRVCVRINLTPQATAVRGSCFVFIVFTSCVNNRGDRSVGACNTAREKRTQAL